MAPVVTRKEPSEVLKETPSLAVAHGALGFLKETLASDRGKETSAYDAVSGNKLLAKQVSLCLPEEGVEVGDNLSKASEGGEFSPLRIILAHEIGGLSPHISQYICGLVQGDPRVGFDLNEGGGFCTSLQQF